MKLTCLIVDDEPLAREGLENYAKKIPYLHIAAICEHAMQAVEEMEKNKIDLLFLDIQMPLVSGIDFIKSLPDPPLIVLTTAFPMYALEGYQLNVLDYLVKPIAFDRFLKAANKAKEYYSLKVKAQESLSAIAEKDYFFIKCEGKYEKITFESIVCVEGLKNYIIIHTDKQKFVTYLTLKNIEKVLPQTQFIKVQKSFIIALSKIETIEGNVIKVGKLSIAISRSNREEVLNQILCNKLLKR
jgi:DNA-binding LytR/AlgR family response regulator